MDILAVNTYVIGASAGFLAWSTSGGQATQLSVSQGGVAITLAPETNFVVTNLPDSDPAAAGAFYTGALGAVFQSAG